MSSYLVQAGTKLYTVSQAGVPTEVTLPSGVTLYGATQPCRAVLFTTGIGQNPIIAVVNGGTQDFYLDPTGTARLLQIQPPIAAPTLSAGSSTGLTGVYFVACTFKLKDANGATLQESALGPSSSASPSLTNQSLRMNNIPVSGDSLTNARGLYRTTSGGNIFYPWFDIDDNLTLTEDRAVADASLSILPTTADTFGAPPDLKLIMSWKDRLWGVPRLEPDHLRWTEERLFYAWNAENEIIVPPAHTDSIGVTAFIPRRDQLGIARYRTLDQIVGDDNNSFTRLRVSDTLGCVSPESVVVIRDVAYFLAERGVVEWTSESIGYCSEAQVNNWFISDDYFNRSLFTSAKGRYNPATDSYELLLAAAGSTSLDRWVSFDIKGRRWFGPHKTAGFTPTCTGTGTSCNGVITVSNMVATVFGSSAGDLYRRDSSQITDAGVAVAFDVDLPFHHGGEADYEKYWGELSVHTRKESNGNLVITPIVGELTEAASIPVVHNLEIPRERLARMGIGKYLQLNLQHSSTNEGLRIYGVEVPYNIVGRR